MWSPKDYAAAIAEHFRAYNEEFGRITRRAALNFLAEDWQAVQLDAVARIELYEQRVTRCVQAVGEEWSTAPANVALWADIKRAYDMLVARRPDSDFYRTFFNSVTRDLFGTVGVNPGGRILRYQRRSRLGRRTDPRLPHRKIAARRRARSARRSAVRRRDPRPGRRGSPHQRRDRPLLRDRTAERGARIHRIDRTGVLPRLARLRRRPPDRRRLHHTAGGCIPQLAARACKSMPSCCRAPKSGRCSAMRAPIFMWICRWSAPRSRCCAPSCRASPSMSCTPCSAAPSKARPSATSRCSAISIPPSTASCTRPGERGLVMIVFTLPSHDLVFKVIRDRFGAPKTSTRAEVMERYQFVFRHDRAGRLVDAQEFKRLRLPRGRFMPALADELLRDASESCRIEGEDLIIEHCYIERRLRPLNLFLREADPAAAEAAIIDYGNALRDLAASNVFPGDLLLKNFGVTSHGRVIFYDYDEAVPGVGLRVSRSAAAALRRRRDQRRAVVSLRAARCLSGAVAAVPVDSRRRCARCSCAHHAELLTAAWWRAQAARPAEAAAMVAPVGLGAPQLARDQPVASQPHSACRFASRCAGSCGICSAICSALAPSSSAKFPSARGQRHALRLGGEIEQRQHSGVLELQPPRRLHRTSPWPCDRAKRSGLPRRNSIRRRCQSKSSACSRL